MNSFYETNCILVPKSKIAENGDYNLTGDRYRETMDYSNAKWPMVELGEVCEFNPRKSEVKELDKEMLISFVPMADLNEHQISFEAKETKKLKDVFSSYTYFAENDVLLARVTPCFENGKSGIAKNLANSIGFGSSEYFVYRANQEKILPDWIYYFISSNQFIENGKINMSGTGGLQRLTKEYATSFTIPLPPLEVQEQIVAEIEQYQKVIDGAKQVIKNWKPSFRIDPSWEMVELGEVCEVISGQSPKGKYYNEKQEGLPFYQGKTEFQDMYIGKPKKWTSLTTKIALKNDILMSVRAPVGPVNFATQEICIGRGLASIRGNEEKINQTYLFYVLRNKEKDIQGNTGAAFNSINRVDIQKILIPLPPLEVQEQIVAEIEAEQKAIDECKKLIEKMQKKIETKISEVWGEDS